MIARNRTSEVLLLLYIYSYVCICIAVLFTLDSDEGLIIRHKGWEEKNVETLISNNNFFEKLTSLYIWRKLIIENVLQIYVMHWYVYYKVIKLSLYLHTDWLHRYMSCVCANQTFWYLKIFTMSHSYKNLIVSLSIYVRLLGRSNTNLISRVNL